MSMDSCPISQEHNIRTTGGNGPITITLPDVYVRWTPVETPPSIDGWYLVTYEEPRPCEPIMGFEEFFEGSWPIGADVIAWAPLPHPYRETKDG